MPPREENHSDKSANSREGQAHDPLCLTRDRLVGSDQADYASNQFCVCGVRNDAVER
jgi:hypothetical protein